MSHKNDEKSTLIVLKSQQEPSGIDWTGSKFDVWLIEMGEGESFPKSLTFYIIGEGFCGVCGTNIIGVECN